MNVEAGLPLNASTWGAGLRGPVPYFFDGIWFMHQDTLVQLLLACPALVWFIQSKFGCSFVVLGSYFRLLFMSFDHFVCRALGS